METKQGRVGCALAALLFLTGLAYAQDEKKKETAPSLDGTSGSAKAEGLAVVAETGQHWDVLIVFDGLPDGHAVRFRVDKP